MKISRMRHVIITCIIFLIIIVGILTVYNGKLNQLRENAQELVFRVVATKDIMPGEVIDKGNVKVVKIPDVTETDNLVYRLNDKTTYWENVGKTEDYHKQLSALNPEKDKEKIAELRSQNPLPNDDLWAYGKIATAKIYKGEMLVADDLRVPSEYVGENERIYNIPFNSLTTGGYNVKVKDKIDICVLYKGDSPSAERNKVIDIVLAKKEIVDIRDEAGNSKKNNPAVVPGYICFKLTYEEINKIELAKRQGQVFAGITDAYSEDAHPETFMSGVSLPSFSPKASEQNPDEE